MPVNRRAVLSAAGLSAVALVVPVGAANDLEANKKVAQDYIKEVWEKGNTAAIDQFVSPDVIPSNPDDAPGIDAFKARVESGIRQNASSVKNIKYSIEDVTAEADRVVIRGYITGASDEGKKITALYLDELLIKSGLIVSEWAVVDTSALYGF